jgi:hypothetical protein
MRRLPGAVCTAALFGIAAFGQPAKACINGTEHREDPGTRNVAAAERALRAGDHQRAAVFALRLHRDLRNIRTKAPLISRAQRVVALVAVRSGGLWFDGKKLSAKSDAERGANLDWALSTLRRRQIEKLDHPGRLSDLGEALSLWRKHHDEARRILEYLAERDLMTSAHGWAALSRLRSELGDESGSARALGRCRKLTKLGEVCSKDVQARS